MQKAAHYTSAVLLLVLALSGCTAAGGVGPEEDGTPSGGSFTGPYADLFESATASAKTDEAITALSDESISEQEYAYFQSQIVNCLAALGLSARFGQDGRLSYSGPEVDQDRINACNKDNGIEILALHDAINRNPDRQDEAAIVVDCLKETGIVGSGYSVADYENGTDLSAIFDSDELEGCSSDPLNYAKNAH